MGTPLSFRKAFARVRYFAIFFVFWISVSSVFAEQGVRFAGSWAEALSQARMSGKMVFLDAYAEWSGPCKLMSKCVFSDAAVGEFYNSEFISIKMDMEKGEGPALAKRYGIWQFPTLLYIDGDGNIQHQAIGFHNTSEFITLGKKALNTELNMFALQQRYNAGERSSGLLYALTEIYSSAFHKDLGKVADQYLKMQNDWSTRQNMEFIFHYTTDPFGPGFKYILKNKRDFTLLFGEEAVNNAIEDVFDGYQKAHPDLPLGEIQRLHTTIYPERGERLASAYRLIYYQKRQNWVAYANSAIDHFARFPTEDADELVEATLLFLHHVDDKSMLKQATKWAERAAELSPTWNTYDTLARLYAVTGKKRQAIKMTHLAIELARNAGEPSANSEAFLEILRE